MFARRVLSCALLGWLLLAAAAAAEICTLDRRPGASALVPYFEVGSIDVVGSAAPERTTTFSLINTDALGTIVHVAVWSEFAVPVLEFQVYLRGFDVQTLNMEDLIMRGDLPTTALPSQYPDLFPFCATGLQFPFPFIPDPDNPRADPAAGALGAELSSSGRRSLAALQPWERQRDAGVPRAKPHTAAVCVPTRRPCQIL